MPTAASFQYLNQENRWPDFQLDGLVVTNGTLQLAQVPGNPEPVGPPLDTITALTGPAGIGVDNQGNLYIVDPANQRILRVDACNGSSAPLVCLRGPGSEPGQLRDPRGLVVGPRHALYVADSANHRIQVIDVRTPQVRAIWGQPDPLAPPTADGSDGRFDTPLDLAVDRTGNFYVVDYGNRRIQKFDANGQVQPGFWVTMQQASIVPQEPVAIATATLDTDESVLIIDRVNNTLLVYQLDGTLDEPATQRWQNVAALAVLPVKVAMDAHFLYVADAATGRVLVFDQQGRFIGAARGTQVAAGLALDKQGRLLVHPGGGFAVQRFTPAVAYLTCGSFLAGPFRVGSQPVQWQRLAITADPLVDGSHVQFFTYTSQTMDGTPGNQPQPPVTCAGLSEGLAATQTVTLASLDEWRPAATDNFDFLALNQNGRYLWLAGVIQGNGATSPALHQIRLEYDTESWVRYLPAVHQRNAANRLFLDRALALFQSLLNDQAALIDMLPRLFDPLAAPNVDAPNSWLDWLSGWLAFALDETWSEPKRREALAEAFALSAQRGTVVSLRRLIELYAGATAHIEEPARFATLWSLGESSRLGFDTMLAPAHAQGAVVGTTATLNQSHLIQDEDYGAPLFEDVAHRFCVQVYAADLAGSGATLEKVRDIIEREKPAHTTYHLCLIEPRMRVGFQARIGIDTIIGGAPTDLALTAQRQLGMDMVLPAVPEQVGVLGQQTRVGVSTTLL
jgi:phage tail-like protein